MPSFPSSYIEKPSDETPESNEYITRTNLAIAGGTATVAMLGALYYYNKYHYVQFGGKKWFWPDE